MTVYAAEKSSYRLKIIIDLPENSQFLSDRNFYNIMGRFGQNSAIIEFPFLNSGLTEITYTIKK